MTVQPTSQGDSMPGPYVQTWETYQELGWQGILPLPERKKANPPRGYTGASGAWPTYADCWCWSDDPDMAGANIALRLPDGIIGIDVDAYDGKPGADTLAATQKQWGDLPDTWRTTSRDDGTSGIRLYRAPAGLAWPGEVGPGIEIIQERHRYAVAPPSLHPEGRTYRWITPGGAVSTVPPAPSDLAELPAAWVDGLTRGTTYEAAPRVDLDDHQVGLWITTQPRAAEPPCDRMRHQVDAALLTLTEGSAHNNANLAAMRLIRLSDEGHAGVTSALADLRNAFLAEATRAGRAGQARSEQEAAAEWARNIRGAVQLVAGRPSSADTCDCGSGLADLIAPTTPSAASASPAATHTIADAEEARRLARERMISEELTKLEVREEAKRRLRARQRPAEPPKISILSDFLSIEDPPQRYRMEGLWPLGGRVMLAAQFKAGKTTMVGNLVRSLVDGDDFLGSFSVEPLTEGRRVVVIDDELDERMIRAWLRDQGIANTGRAAVLPLRGNLASFDILDPAVRSQWAAALRQAGAEVVVLDCLAPVLDALGLSEDKEAGQLLVAFDELLGEAGVSEAVVVHHMGHSGERTRGASRLRDWPDVEWRLVREKGEEGENAPDAPRFFSAYGRDVDVKESALQFDPATRRLSISGGSRKDVKSEQALELILDYLTENPKVSGRQIEDALAEELPQKVLRAALKKGRATGQIVTEDGPRRSILHSAGPNPAGVSASVRQSASPVRQRTVSECVSASIRDALHSHSPDTPTAGVRQTHSHPPRRGSTPRLHVIDGRIIDATSRRVLTAQGDDLIDPDTGEIVATTADLPGEA